MSGEFDPYHKWLGISPREQPPNHYRLLAIDVFEDDPEVIDAAANRQMSYLQELASGPNVRHAQNLLNEISAARVCLLDKQRKAEYDAKLRAEVAAPSPPPASPLPPSPPPVEASAPLPPRPSVRPPANPSPPDRGPLIDTGRGPGIAIDTRAKTAPRRGDTQRAAKTIGRPKSKSNTPIIVAGALLLLVVTCAAIAFGVAMSGNSNDGDVAQRSPASDGRPAKLDRRVDEARDHRQTPLPNFDSSPVPDQASDMPEPGANLQQPSPEPPNTAVDNSGVETSPPQPAPSDQPKLSPQDSPPVDPPVAKPAPNKPPVAAPPESLKHAYAALQRKDVEQVIALLEKCLSSNPPSPYKEEAEALLQDAKHAISENEAKTSLLALLRKLNEKQIEEIKKTGVVQITPDLRIPAQHPILKQVFLGTFKKFLEGPEGNLLVNARLNGMLPDEVAANDSDKKPKDNETSPEKTDPQPKKPQPAPRPTEPAALLAAEGLTKDGSRWMLADLEHELKDRLTKISQLEKKISTARAAISQSDRQRLATAQKALGQKQAELETEMRSLVGKLVPKKQIDDLNERKAQNDAFQKKLDSAQERVTQADVAAAEALEELKPEVDLFDEKIKLFEDTYERLTNDKEVLAAIENQGGGALSSPSALKAWKNKVLRLQKAIDDGEL